MRTKTASLRLSALAPLGTLTLMAAACGEPTPALRSLPTGEPAPPAARSASRSTPPAPRGPAPSRSVTAEDFGPSRSVVGYRHGQPIELSLVRLDGEWVEIETARFYRAMLEAARRSGVELRIMSGFRTQEEQSRLYRCWRRGRCPLAARPGYSQHQSGLALDLDVRSSPRAGRWLAEHASGFGFRRTVRGEPWHWERELR